MGRAEPTVRPGLEEPWWLQEAPPDPGGPPLDGDATADVAVVGGGYTGLWTALELKARSPDLEVVVLEAAYCGHGPSGRNGGFLETYWPALPRLRDRLGDSGALELARASEGVFDAVRALSEDVWLHEGGMIEVSASPRQDAAVEQVAAAARALGAPDEVSLLSTEQLESRIRSPRFRRAAFVRRVGTVQPARLVRAMRRGALAAGVRLHERTRVTRIRDGLLETSAGQVRAKDIVVATNAWAAGWGPLARVLTPFGSYVVLTEPVPDLADRVGWAGGEAITDGRMFLHYFRATPDGRVLMGSGSGPIGFAGRIDRRFSHDAPSAGRAEAGLRLLLPGLDGVRIEYSWGGPIDVSADHLPVFGTVPGTRIHYGAGYTGNGVGPSWLGGKILASLVLGADDDWSRLPLVRRRVPRLPPEPLNFIGGRLVRAAMLAREEAEEAGRTAPAHVRLVASLPERLGLRIGTR